MDLLPHDLRARMNTLIIGSMMDGEGRIFIHLRPTHMQSYVGSIVHILTITSQIEDGCRPYAVHLHMLWSETALFYFLKEHSILCWL